MTTYTDTFTGADGTLLSGTASAFGTNWVENSGNWKITSNAARVTAGANRTLVYETSITDGEFQVTAVTFPTTNNSEGLIFRFIDVNNYWMAGFQLGGGGATPGSDLVKVVGGAGTSMGFFTSGMTTAANQTVGIRVNGNVIQHYVNGVQVNSITDPTHNTGTKVGLGALGQDIPLDNFTFTPLNAPTSKSSSDSLAFTNNTATIMNTRVVADSAAVSEVATFVDTTPFSPDHLAILDQASVAKYTGGVWSNPPHQAFTRHRTPVPTRQQDFLPTHHIEGNP